MREVLFNKGLTPREVDIAVLVAKGWANKAVAASLFVEEKTVKFHLTNIFKKLKLKSRSELIVWCIPHMASAPLAQHFEVKPSAVIAAPAPTIPAEPLPKGR